MRSSVWRAAATSIWERMTTRWWKITTTGICDRKKSIRRPPPDPDPTPDPDPAGSDPTPDPARTLRLPSQPVLNAKVGGYF